MRDFSQWLKLFQPFAEGGEGSFSGFSPFHPIINHEFMCAVRDTDSSIFHGML